MERHTIFVKGMVCNRCVLMVKNELENLGHESIKVSLGEVSFLSTNNDYKLAIENSLRQLGLTLLEDKKLKMIQEIKILIEQVFSGEYDFPESFRFAKLLSHKMGKDYDTISDAFVASEKKTIEHFIIEFRINKVKEFLVYTNLTLADIAFKLNFNSVAHLSTQFKQHTGLTPSFFKGIKKHKVDKASSAMVEN